jgi:hypothetical protein
MFARIVRFTDVTPEGIADVVARIEESGGPPPGVDSVGLQLIYDESQSTALFLGLFETEEKMVEGGKVLDALDTGDTPGTRASIDMGEVQVDQS